MNDNNSKVSGAVVAAVVVVVFLILLAVHAYGSSRYHQGQNDQNPCLQPGENYASCVVNGP